MVPSPRLQSAPHKIRDFHRQCLDSLAHQNVWTSGYAPGKQETTSLRMSQRMISRHEGMPRFRRGVMLEPAEVSASGCIHMPSI